MSPKRLIFQYMKLLTKFDGLKTFISPKMMVIIIYPDHHGKEASCSGSGIHYLYIYIDIIGAHANSTYVVHNYHSSSLQTNIDSGSLYQVISSLIGKQNIACACCGWPVHNTDSCIIISEKFLLPSL